MSLKELGKRIRRARTKSRISQEALAAVLGKSHGWVSLIERGQIGDPRGEDLTAIALYLEEDPVEFLRLAGKASIDQAVGLTIERRLTLTKPELQEIVTLAVNEAVDEAMKRVEVMLAATAPPNPPLHVVGLLPPIEQDVAAIEGFVASTKSRARRTPPAHPGGG